MPENPYKPPKEERRKKHVALACLLYASLLLLGGTAGLIAGCWIGAEWAQMSWDIEKSELEYNNDKWKERAESFKHQLLKAGITPDE